MKKLEESHVKLKQDYDNLCRSKDSQNDLVADLQKSLKEKGEKLESLKVSMTNAVRDAEKEAIAEVMKEYNFNLACSFRLGWLEGRYRDPDSRTWDHPDIYDQALSVNTSSHVSSKEPEALSDSFWSKGPSQGVELKDSTNGVNPLDHILLATETTDKQPCSAITTAPSGEGSKTGITFPPPASTIVAADKINSASHTPSDRLPINSLMDGPAIPNLTDVTAVAGPADNQVEKDAAVGN